MIRRASGVIFRSLRGQIVAAALLWSVGLFMLWNHVISRLIWSTWPGLRQSNQLLIWLIGTWFVLAGLLIAASAVRKVDAVRKGVAALRSGEGKRLQAGGFAEIEPLVSDMNALLDFMRKRASQ